MKKIVFVLALVGLIFVGCKSEAKKQDKKEEVLATNLQQSAFKISGMTCEVGCAKKIQSDLSKKEGVVDAKVVFLDSIATVKYDAAKIDRAGLATFIEGIADGKTYEVIKISDVETASGAKQCKPGCTKQCSGATKSMTAKACTKKCKDAKAQKQCGPNCKGECGSGKAANGTQAKKPCSPTCVGECDSTKKATAKSCSPSCKKECTKKSTTATKKQCSPNCTGKCGDKKKETAKSCSKDCKKECCSTKA